MSTPIHTGNAEQYTWGDNCSGWHLCKTAALGVIEETMPPGTAETFHLHQHVQQFFYLLEGEACFEFETKTERVKAGQGIHITAGTAHRIKNESTQTIRFLVVSQPHAHGDRHNL